MAAIRIATSRSRPDKSPPIRYSWVIPSLARILGNSNWSGQRLPNSYKDQAVWVKPTRLAMSVWFKPSASRTQRRRWPIKAMSFLSSSVRLVRPMGESVPQSGLSSTLEVPPDGGVHGQNYQSRLLNCLGQREQATSPILHTQPVAARNVEGIP